MAITPTGPCEGFAAVADIPTDAVCRQVTSGDGGATDAEIEELIEEATDLLWVLLARPSIGQCTSTIYPCRSGSGWLLESGAPRRSVIGQLTSYHGCPPDLVKLDTPVASITEVVVAGTPLAASEYVLQDGRWLAKANGSTWPVGSMTDLDAFRITYVHGSTVPPLIRDAVVELVDELWKEKVGIPSVLPPNTKSASRQGMSFQLADPEQVRKAGPSLPKVMKAIGAYNSTNQRFPTAVLSPDDDFHNRVIRTFP